MTAMPHNQGYCVDNCFGCKAAGVSFSAKAMPTRSGIAEQDKFNKVHDKDVAAYKRLRSEGLQPKSTQGAARVEATADSKWEVETGIRVGKAGERYDAAQAAIRKGEVA